MLTVLDALRDLADAVAVATPSIRTLPIALPRTVYAALLADVRKADKRIGQLPGAPSRLVFRGEAQVEIEAWPVDAQ